MKSKENSRNRLSYWQLIFCKSKVNGAPHKDDDLPVSNWDWPTDTYLSSRRSRNEPLVGVLQASAVQELACSAQLLDDGY